MTRKHTHPLDVGYLVMGLIFLGIAGLWALRETHVVDITEMSWLLPLSLIAAGVIGLAAAAAKGAARRRTEHDSTNDTDDTDDTDTDPQQWAYYDDERTSP
jgi:hypothetical protein